MGSKTDQVQTHEYEKLLETAPDLKTKLIIALAGEAGLRAGEIGHMQANWINFQKQQIRIPSSEGQWQPKTKTSSRTIPYKHNTRLKTLIETYFTLQPNINMTRQGIHKKIKQTAEKAGITHNIYPHALRSTAAQKYADAGISTQSLRNIMGWSLLNTAEAYVRRSGINVEKELDYARKRGTL